jgi:hypothetical protein
VQAFVQPLAPLGQVHVKGAAVDDTIANLEGWTNQALIIFIDISQDLVLKQVASLAQPLIILAIPSATEYEYPVNRD